MTKLFEVIIHCTEKRLPTILSVLDGAMELQLVKKAGDDVVQSNAPKAAAQHHRRYYANGKHDKGISGADLAMHLLKAANGPLSIEKMGDAFAARGFSRSTASPSVTKLKQEGHAEWVSKGVYRLIKKPAAASA